MGGVRDAREAGEEVGPRAAQVASVAASAYASSSPGDDVSDASAVSDASSSQPSSSGRSPTADDLEAFSVTDVGSHILVAAPRPVELDRGDVLAGRYQIEALIGSGGSGRVLRAFDRVSEMAVALKILKPELAGDPVWERRFSRELRVGRQIQHPNVCRVFDIGEADGHRFLSMELATGGSIRGQVRASALTRPWEDRIADARAVIEGVAALHRAGIVHRDVKPENILRMDDGRAIVSDFGLATDLGAGPAVTVMVGTPSYMAPEVVMGDPATTRSDVWATGVVLHEILFGRRPEWTVEKSVAGAVVAAATDGGTRIKRKLRLPDAPGLVITPAMRRLALLCGECATESPSDRPRDGAEILRKWDAALTGKSSLSRRRRREIVRSVGWAAIAAACVGLFFVGRSYFKKTAEASSSRGGATDLTGLVHRPALASGESAVRMLATYNVSVDCLSAIPGRDIVRIGFGEPRRFEDLEPRTGRRTAWPFSNADTDSCPVWSPDGSRVLYEAGSLAGLRVWMARGDGSNAIELTSGSAPTWIGSDEFAYDIDSSHVAIFSLATMESRLLSDPAPETPKEIAQKSLGEARRELLVRYVLDDGKALVAAYSLPATTPRLLLLPENARGIVPSAEGAIFVTRTAPGGDELVQVSASLRASESVFRANGREISRSLSINGRGVLFAARETATDVNVTTAAGSEHVATLRSIGAHPLLGADDSVLLQSVRGGESSIVHIDHRNRTTRTLTSGGFHVRPSFSADGTHFYFTDVRRQTVVRCTLNTGTPCDDFLTMPGFPVAFTESPDQKQLVFLASNGAPHIYLFDKGGRHHDLGPSRSECPPIWADSRTVWVLRGTERAPYWALVDTASGTQLTNRAISAGRHRDYECGSTPLADAATVSLRRQDRTEIGLTGF